MSLHSFLRRLIWLCVSPLVLLAAYLAIDQVQTIQAERDLQAANMAKNLATTIDQELNARMGALHILAVSPLLDDATRWKDLYQEAQGFRQSFDSHVLLANPDMQMLFNTRLPFGTPLPLLPRPKGRAATVTAMSTGQPAVGDIFFGPIAGEPLVALVVPVQREGKTSHLLLGIFATRQFQKYLDQLALPTGWSLSLLDSTQAVIARRPRLEERAPDTAGNTAERFVASSQLAPWSVVVEIPRKTYWTPLGTVALALLIAILGATLAGVIGGTLASRRLGRALSSLAEPSVSGPPSQEIAEITEVRRLLNEAAAKREIAEAAGRESERRFQLLFHEAPLPLCFVSTKGLQMDFNARFEQVFGYNHQELSSMAKWWPLAYPDPSYRAWVLMTWNAAVEHAAKNGTDIQAVEYRVTCKDGSQRIMLISGILLGEDILTSFFDVTERRKTENDISNLNIQLEQRVAERTVELQSANLELEDLAYALTHNLRAPLRAISGFSQVLINEHGGQFKGEASSCLEQILLASSNMGRLIDGILALLRCTRGELHRENIDISALATKHLAELSHAVPSRQVDFQVAPNLVVVGDVAMVTMALTHLLDNAWKFTRDPLDARIQVLPGTIEGQPGICVTDNGAGFDMAHAGHLFQPFQRLHRADEFPGIGIGLATVQRIIRRHGGEIRATATPGVGATFCFSLPPARMEMEDHHE